MKIDELISGRLSTPSIPSSDDFLSTKKIDTVDGYPIHHFPYNSFNNVYAILNDDGTYKGYLACSGNYFKETFVIESERKKGIMSILLLCSLRKQSSLIIDENEVVSDDSRIALFKLFKNGKINIKDGSSKKNLSVEEFNKIINTIGSSDVSLILEPTHGPVKENFWEFRQENNTAIIESLADGTTIKSFWWD